MAKQLYHFEDLDLITETIEVHVSMQPTAKRVQKAHNNLQVNISNSMQDFMPQRDGFLREQTRAANVLMIGTEWVYAAHTPGKNYGRVTYRGLLMVDAVTGSPWARKGAKKVVTDRPLNLTRGNPNAQAEWFKAAKARDGKEWERRVQEDLGG